MTGKITFDANIFFYAHDAREAAKHRRCAEILKSAIGAGTGFVTLQALGEFGHASVRKNVLTRGEAAAAARDWAIVLEVAWAGAEAFDLALGWWAEERFSYWDALLIATAAKAGATALASEDFGDGPVVAGVEIINPFTKGARARLKAHGLTPLSTVPDNDPC